MKRLGVMILAGLGLLLAPEGVRGDDFGDFLGRAAKKSARDLIERSVPAIRQGGGPGLPGQGGPGFAGQGGSGLASQIIPGLAGQAAVAQPEPYPMRTADGWTLVAHRYRPSGPPRPGALPVILCHGLSYNASFWDLDPSCSFARYLAEQGYDVWAVDLRGSGMSQKWVWKLDEAPTMLVGSALRKMTKGKLAPTGYATIDPKAANWDLDSHITYDVPALVKLVRHHTRSAEVAWVGHSMGGIVAIAHLARYPNPGIGRLVTVGSQVTMANSRAAVAFLQEMLATRQQQIVGELRGEELIVQTRTSVHNLFFNVRNVNQTVYEALAGPAADIPSIGVLKQYMTLATQRELVDSKRQFNYARSLGNVRVPILITCGELDQFAPPREQQFIHANVGSTDKKLVFFGRSSGLPVDCGHDDALVGLNSRAQVYPVIEGWLRGVR